MVGPGFYRALAGTRKWIFNGIFQCDDTSVTDVENFRDQRIKGGGFT
jgi:hypothetical protein